MPDQAIQTLLSGGRASVLVRTQAVFRRFRPRSQAQKKGECFHPPFEQDVLSVAQQNRCFHPGIHRTVVQLVVFEEDLDEGRPRQCALNEQL